MEPFTFFNNFFIPICILGKFNNEVMLANYPTIIHAGKSISIKMSKFAKVKEKKLILHIILCILVSSSFVIIISHNTTKVILLHKNKSTVVINITIYMLLKTKISTVIKYIMQKDLHLIINVPAGLTHNHQQHF